MSVNVWVPLAEQPMQVEQRLKMLFLGWEKYLEDLEGRPKATR
jgi:hypothetical protein